MPDSLYQKDLFFHQKWFELSPEGISVRQKGLFNSNEYTLKYDGIGTKIVKSKSSKKTWLIISILLFLLATGLLIEKVPGGGITLALSILFLAIFFFTFKHSFFLATQDNKSAIEFLTYKPSKQELQEFINKIKNKRKDYLLDKYGQITKMLSYQEQYHSLLWLSDNDVITKEEYDNKLQQLNAMFNPTTHVIGFQTRRDDIQ